MPTTHSRLVASFLFCLAAACAREPQRADTVAARPTPAADRRAEWVVTPRGLRPLHAGMTRTEAEAVVGGSLAIAADSAWKECGYTPGERLPAGVRIMVENGTIARIEVDSGSVATAEGARIGDLEDRVRQLYGSGVAVSPHKYVNGHYLTVKPAAAADSLFRIVFETSDGRVTSYRAGRLPAVEYVEGCA